MSAELFIPPAVPASDRGARVRVEVGGEEPVFVLIDGLMEWVQEAYGKQGKEGPYFHDSTEPSTGKDMVIVEVRGLGPIACRDIPDAAEVALNDLHPDGARCRRVERLSRPPLRSPPRSDRSRRPPGAAPMPREGGAEMGAIYDSASLPEHAKGTRLRVVVSGETRAVVAAERLDDWVCKAFEEAGEEIPFFHDAVEPSTGNLCVLVDIKGSAPFPAADLVEACRAALEHLLDERVEVVGER